MMQMNYENPAGSNAAAIIPNMTPIDVKEQVEIMKHQEESTSYKCNDFFGRAVSNTDFHNAPQHIAVTPDSRTKMCEWSFQVVDYCQFRRETVDIAMSFLDRFLSAGCTKAREALRDKRQYQLAAMTGLYMAIKLHEPLEMDTELLSEVSRGEYSSEDIAQMERIMLTALKWRVNGPTRLTFALHFTALLPAKLCNNNLVAETLLELILFQTEIATADYYFTTRKQSTAGLACVLNALDAMGLGKKHMDAFINAIIRYGGMNPFSSDVREARSRLVEAVGGVEELCNMSEQLTMQSASQKWSLMEGRKVSSGRYGVEKDENIDEESSPVCVSRTAIER